MVCDIGEIQDGKGMGSRSKLSTKSVEAGLKLDPSAVV